MYIYNASWHNRVATFFLTAMQSLHEQSMSRLATVIELILLWFKKSEFGVFRNIFDSKIARKHIVTRIGRDYGATYHWSQPQTNPWPRRPGQIRAPFFGISFFC